MRVTVHLIFFLVIMGLRAAEAQVKVSEIKYGTSFLGKSLLAYKLYKDGDFSSRKSVLITEGVHGNEYMGIVEKLPSIFQKRRLPGFRRFIDEGGILLVVPQMNPDGVARRRRKTMMAVDLNRDFAPDKLNEQESYLFSQWIESELRKSGAELVLAIDYHCCKGAIIHPDFASPSKSNAYARGVKEITHLMQRHVDSSYAKGTTREIFGRPNNGTLKSYLFRRFGALSLTFEGISPKEEGEKLSEHVKWWDSLFVVAKRLSHLQKIQQSNE